MIGLGSDKKRPGDNEPLSNSNCLERLREFQLKMYRGWGGVHFASCINNPKKRQPTPWYTINKTGARKIDRGAISQLKNKLITTSLSMFTSVLVETDMKGLTERFIAVLSKSTSAFCNNHKPLSCFTFK